MQDGGVPVRVIRRVKDEDTKQDILRYDGLYRVRSWRWDRAEGASSASSINPYVLKFGLRRMAGQPALQAARSVGFHEARGVKRYRLQVTGYESPVES